MLFMEKSLRMAYQLATMNHLSQLADRIDLIRKAKFSEFEVEPDVVHVSKKQRPKSVVKPVIAPRPVEVQPAQEKPTESVFEETSREAATIHYGNMITQ